MELEGAAVSELAVVLAAEQQVFEKEGCMPLCDTERSIKQTPAQHNKAYPDHCQYMKAVIVCQAEQLLA